MSYPAARGKIKGMEELVKQDQVLLLFVLLHGVA